MVRRLSNEDFYFVNQLRINTIMITRAVKKKMSPLSSLHQYLDTTCDWNIQELKTIITQNPSCINTVSSCENMTPLIKVLGSEKCTVDIVKLLLDHGADVNFKDQSPLMVALYHCADYKVIAILLDNGANVDVHYNLLSPLCVALRSNCSKHIIQRLLDAGCSVHACKKHSSLIHCFCSSHRWGMRRGILRLVITAGADVENVDLYGKSMMCLALRFGVGSNDIKLLLQVGISLKECIKHPSPFHCLLEDPNRKLLEVDVVRVLLHAGAHFDVAQNGSTLLHDILRKGNYEVEVIRMLLDVPGVDVNGRNRDGETLLHCAVGNTFCPLSVLQLLLDKGAEVGKLDANRMTALDVAIANNAQFQVFKFLLEKGSPINTQDLASSRPLTIALERRVHDDVVMTLLLAGARVGMTLNFFSINLRLAQYLRNREAYGDHISDILDRLKCYIKCYILEDSEFPIVSLTSDPIIHDKLQGFTDECKLELGEMDSERVGLCRTLRQLISRKSPPRTITADCCMSEGKDFDFNRLLAALSGTNAFPLYFDFISASIGKKAMEKKLHEVPVYTVIDSPCTDKKKVNLNYDIVYKIAGLLSDADLLKMILAFNKPKNHAGSKRSQLLKLIQAFDKPENHACGKRGSEEQDVVGPEPSCSQKRPKQV